MYRIQVLVTFHMSCFSMSRTNLSPLLFISPHIKHQFSSTSKNSWQFPHCRYTSIMWTEVVYYTDRYHSIETFVAKRNVKIVSIGDFMAWGEYWYACNKIKTVSKFLIHVMLATSNTTVYVYNWGMKVRWKCGPKSGFFRKQGYKLCWFPVKTILANNVFLTTVRILKIPNEYLLVYPWTMFLWLSWMGYYLHVTMCSQQE